MHEEKHGLVLSRMPKLIMNIPCTETCLQGPYKQYESFRAKEEIKSFYGMHNDAASLVTSYGSMRCAHI